MRIETTGFRSLNVLRKNLALVNYSLVVVLGCLISFLTKDFRLDDALIYYRYIENCLNGNGLVYNIGERFNAISSPLYIYISLAASLITREVETTQFLMNSIFVILSGISLAYLFYFLNKPTLAFLSSMIFITTKYFYMTFGLESNLFILLSLVCIILYFRKNQLGLSIVSGLLVLTRGEGLFLVLILWALIFYEQRKISLVKYLLLAGLIVIANNIFNYLYFDSFLPHTLTAKMSQGESGYWGESYSFILSYNFLFRMAFNNQPYFVLYIILLFLVGFTNHIRGKITLILFSYSVFIALFHITLNIQNYHWYYAIHFLTMVVFISYGIIDVVRFFRTKISAPVLRRVLLILIFAYPVLTQIELFRLLQREGPILGYKAAGEWLKKNTPPDVKVAGVEIGHLGWYSKRYTVDMLGLVNPGLADFVGRRETDMWFNIYKPEYILVHKPIRGPEQLAQKYVENGTYIEVDEFKYDDIRIYKLKNK
mgnify:CR=1 FL=1